VYRAERDVLKNTLSHVLIQNGQNDLGTVYTGDQVIAAYREMIAMAQERGVKVVIATINPRDSFNATQNAYRHQINDWIRAGGNCGGQCAGFVDFDEAIKDPANPEQQNPDYRTDGIHPNDAGHAHMARIVDLAVFD
jgi:lysophospholipase L1-like esterase